MNNNSEWITAGYSTEAVSNKVDLVSEISRLKREKNAIIMAHYYQVKDRKSVV